MRLKRTKSELKRQREHLKRYQRYLPTLQLKKQQLQAEVSRVEQERQALLQKAEKVRRERQAWVALFGDAPPFTEWLQVKRLEWGSQHIAGVDVPTLERLEFIENVPDRYERPTWVDDGLRALSEEAALRLQLEVLRIQEQKLSDELRTTSQRVNLFEKVKIPECRENIRVIRIALGDEQVAAVARAKLAKGREDAA